jgi:hypothetical protein
VGTLCHEWRAIERVNERNLGEGCWLNTYPTAVSRTHMAEIQCPHCERDIELEPGVFGLFGCPHCDEEFSWDKMEQRGWFESGKLILRLVVKWGFLLSFTLFALGIISLFLFAMMDSMMIFESLGMIIASVYVLLGSMAFGIIGAIIGVFKDD